MKKRSFDDEIIKFVYIIAIRDAVQQQAYKGKKDWLWNKDVIENDKSIKNVISDLSSFVNQILDGRFINDIQDNYDTELTKCVKNIMKNINCAESNPDREKNGEIKKEKDGNDIVFSFGNAQKLINMTVKYIYITLFRDKGNNREKFKYCHCPMDGLMLKNVWKNKNSLKEIDLGNSEFYSNDWGKETINSKRYKIFQKAVRQLAKKSDCYPIEYDYMNW